MRFEQRPSATRQGLQWTLVKDDIRLWICKLKATAFEIPKCETFKIVGAHGFGLETREYAVRFILFYIWNIIFFYLSDVRINIDLQVSRFRLYLNFV